MDKKYLIGGAVVILLLAIAALAMSGNSEATEKADNELIMAVDAHGGEPEGGYDPLTGWGSSVGNEPLIQSRVFKTDGEGNIVNDLATDYSMSADCKTLDVTLRDDVKFTDDTPLTAEDVAFTFNTAKETGASVDVSTLDTATAVDDTHVKFTFSQPDSSFPYKMAMLGIVPSDSYNNETYGQNPVGSGPYKLVQWDKGQQVILEANENYYGEKPYYKKITQLYLDHDAAIAAAKKGDLDLVEVPLSYANETIEGMHTVAYPSADVRTIALPTVMDTGETTDEGQVIGNNVTGDIAIRQALNYGINRDEIISGSFNGLGNKSVLGIGTELPWYNDETFTDGDVDKAKQILADAGWEDTDGDGIVEKDGQKATFSLEYLSDDSTRQSIALQVADQAKEFGIEIEPKGVTRDEWAVDRYSQPSVFGGGYVNPYTMYGQYSSEVAHDGFNNPGSYNNSAVDEAIQTAMSQDTKSSFSTWASVPALAKDDVPWLWIASVDYLYFVSDSLDLSDDTRTIYPHAGDIWGNICDWKPADNNNTTSES